jgi:hypothetical protein
LDAVDMCVVVVMTHGYGDFLFSSDGRELDRNWIKRQFVDTQSLVGKPKLFIFQACRSKT